MIVKEMNTGWRSASPSTPAAARRSIGVRRSGSSVSGSATATSKVTEATTAANTTNTTRHDATCTMKPPTAGASTGAAPHAAPSMPSTDTSLAPRKQSAAIVAASRRHVPAPMPCTNRSPSSMGIAVATAQPTLVTIIRLSPVSSTRLRPIASAISPMGNTTRAIPRTYAVTVFCASAFEDAKCAAILGSAGAYMSKPTCSRGATTASTAMRRLPARPLHLVGSATLS